MYGGDIRKIVVFGVDFLQAIYTIKNPECSSFRLTTPTPMEIHVISPEGNHIYTNISEVSIPTTSGRITIRPDHVNITTTLAEGKMTRTDDTTVSDLESFADQTKQLHIPGGIALFSDERLEIITSNTLL